MQKSLGQWTVPSLKPRKIIPSQLTVVPSKPPPADKGQGEPSTREETEYVVNCCKTKCLIFAVSEISIVSVSFIYAVLTAR